MKLTHLKIDYSDFNNTLKEVRCTYDLLCEIRDSIPTVIKKTEKFFRKYKSNLRICESRVSGNGSLSLCLNIRTPMAFFEKLEQNLCKKTGFKGRSISVYDPSGFCRYIYHNESYFQTLKIKK